MMKLTCVLLVILIAESLSADYDPKCVDESGNPISTNGFQIEGECETFQQCSNGILVTKSCGEGLAFDPLTGICNYPSQVSGCEYMDGVDPSLAGYCRDEDGNVLNPPPSPTRKPGTCDTYYECSNGGLIERTCAPPLVFNPDFGACDWEASSPYCEPGTTPPPPDTTTTQPTTTSTTTTPTTTTPTTTTTTTTPTTTTTTTTPTTTTTTTTTPPTTTTTTTTTPSSTDGTTTRNSPPVTKPTSTEGGISTTPGPTESDLCFDEDGNPITSSVPFGKKGECKTYYVCSHGILYTKQCGDGLAFDPSISMCNHALSVPGCEEYGGADPDLAGYCIDDEGNTLVPPPPPVLKTGTCNTFYTCEGSILVETECAPGQVFNPEVGNCDHTYNSPNCTVPTTQATAESPVTATEPAATDSDDEVKTTEETMPVVGTSEASPHSSTTPKVPAPDATAPITSGTDDPFPHESTTKVVKPSTSSPDPHPPTEPDLPTTTRHAVPPEIATTAAAEGGEVTTKGDSIKPEPTAPGVKPSSPAEITTSQPASSRPGDSGPDESTSQRPAVPATTGPDPQPPSPVPTTVGHGPPLETTVGASSDTTAADITTTATTTSTSTTTTTSAPEALSYLGFVVDDTGSMYNEIDAVKEWMTNCVNGVYTDCENLPTGGWLMNSFNDPVYKNGPVIGPTTDASVVIDAIGDLKANGGGDCPEYAMTGLESAIDAIPDDAGSCKMFFWTDALAKDWVIASTVYEKYIKKRCTFIPILTGCCGYCDPPCDPDNPYPESCDYSVVDDRATAKRRRRRSTSASDETVYYTLASDTGGTIFITDKPSSPEDMLDFLEEEVTLGFCPTSEVAGPPPSGYDKHDCNITKQCWDQSESTCYCTSETEPCPKDPIPTAPTVPECAQDEPHAYFADPNNCTLFYQCASGTMWHMPCPTGLVFDPSISVCNWPSAMAPPCGTCSVCIEE